MKKNYLKSNRKGFTLIELLCVISILAILLAVAAPSVIKTRDTAQQRAFDSQVRTLTTAAMMFALENPGQAVIWSGFAQQAADDREIASTNLQDSWMDFITVWPHDPTRGNDATFTVEIAANGDISISPDTYGN